MARRPHPGRQLQWRLDPLAQTQPRTVKAFRLSVSRHDLPIHSRPPCRLVHRLSIPYPRRTSGAHSETSRPHRPASRAFLLDTP